LTVDQIQGAWAILPTPSKANASDWRSQDTVDLDETARAVEGLIDAGIDGILALGTLGECATLTREEKRNFLATAVEAVRRRIPFFAGTTSLSTRDTIEQTREAYDIGADGTMLGLPMWCPADVPAAVNFFRDVAEACPEVAICVYANPGAFRFNFPPPFWAQISELPQVVTAKYPSGGRLLSDLNASKRRIRILPIDMDYYAGSRMDPEFVTAFWSSGAVCGPRVATRLRDAVANAKVANDWVKAKQLSDSIAPCLAPLIPRGDPTEFAKYNIGLEKARMDAAGWMKAGPCRPPYQNTPEEFLKNARNAGEMWAALERTLKVEQ